MVREEQKLNFQEGFRRDGSGTGSGKGARPDVLLAGGGCLTSLPRILGNTYKHMNSVIFGVHQMRGGTNGETKIKI